MRFSSPLTVFHKYGQLDLSKASNSIFDYLAFKNLKKAKVTWPKTSSLEIFDLGCFFLQNLNRFSKIVPCSIYHACITVSIKCQAIVKGHGNLTSKEFRWSSYIIIEYDKCPKYTILYVCRCQMDTDSMQCFWNIKKNNQMHQTKIFPFGFRCWSGIIWKWPVCGIKTLTVGFASIKWLFAVNFSAEGYQASY